MMSVVPLASLSMYNEDRQRYARSRSLYTCVAEAVDRLHHRQHHSGSGSSGTSHCSGRCTHLTTDTGTLPRSTAWTGLVLRRRDIVHRGSLLSAGALLSAASRRASCPETSRLSTLNVRQQHQRCVPSRSRTVSEEPEENETIGKNGVICLEKKLSRSNSSLSLSN